MKKMTLAMALCTSTAFAGPVNQQFNLESTQAIYQKVSFSKNTAYSPYSLKIALGMLAQGAQSGSSTEKVLSETLGYEGFSALELGSELKSLQETIQKDSTEAVKVKSANLVLANQAFRIKKTFVEKLTDNFQALVKNFAPEVVSEANQWVEKTTNGKIKDLVTAADVDPDNVSVLINAVHFKGNWQTKFDQSLTKPETFFHSGRRDMPRKVETMAMSGATVGYGFLRETGEQVLKLPFKTNLAGEAVASMYFILPGEGQTLKDSIKSTLTNPQFWGKSGLASNLRQRELSIVKIPKFKIETTVDLKEALSSMPSALSGHIAHIFDHPDFRGIADTPPFAVKKIQQKAYVAIDETGAEAAAATKVVVTTRSAAIAPSFIANRPFSYAIRHEATGEILFVGTYVSAAQ